MTRLSERILALGLALGTTWGIGAAGIGAAVIGGAEVARRASAAEAPPATRPGGATSPLPPADAAREVVAFWRDAGPDLWFAKDDAFDRSFRARFLPLHEAAVRGALEGWLATAEGALGLLILLDQFPRNAFRGTPRMYATDAAARAVADRAIAAGHDRAVPAELQVFFVLPFAHSEDPADQEWSVALAHRLGQPHLRQAEHHRDIVRRFGRFPHRNAILGREATPEEREFLEAGGYGG